MLRSLTSAISGLQSFQQRLDVIGNNIANVNTTGFKRERAVFEDLLYQNVRQAGANTSQQTQLPTGLQVGTGVKPVATPRMFTQGNLQQSGNTLDVAIQGNGFFQVQMPDGTTGYTRDGSFKRTGEGLVVNSEGYPLAGDIAVPFDARSLTINAEGDIFAFFDGQTDGQQIGTINLVSFSNEKGLEAIGSNLFRETAASGAPQSGLPGQDGRGVLRQGYLEESSVDVVQQIADLIEAQRGYELNSKVITAADQMLGATTQIR